MTAVSWRTYWVLGVASQFTELAIEREVECEHVHPGLAEEAEVAAFDEIAHQGLHAFDGNTAGARDPGCLPKS